jgi:hypothetical protein
MATLPEVSILPIPNRRGVLHLASELRRAKLEEAVLYIERNPALVKSITSFPYIAKSH